MIVSEELSGAVNEDFARVVKRIIAGRSLRVLARQTGISHTRISDMAFGVVPSYRLLQKFTRTLGVSQEDRDELFRAARYAPPEEPPEDADPYEAFMQGLSRVRRETGVYIPVDLSVDMLRDLTLEKVEQQLADLKAQAEAGLFGPPEPKP